MIKGSKEDIKIILWFILGIGIYILLCRVIVESDIPSQASNDGWLAFFGGLGGGAIAIFGVYITLQHNRKLMDISHQKHMDLMLGQIRTQFWMEKFSETIVVLENIDEDIRKYVRNYNRIESGTVDTIPKFDEKYLLNMIKEINKSSLIIHPKLMRDEDLYDRFYDFKEYILRLNFKIEKNYDVSNNTKLDNTQIEYDFDPYVKYYTKLMEYADPTSPNKH